MGVALFIGVGGARRERDATGQPRVEAFHRALGAGFLLLVAAYFAAAPGLLLWAAGIGFGVGGLMMAYRVYPADRRPDDLKPPAQAPAEAGEAGWVPVQDGPEPDGSPRASATVDSGAPIPLAQAPLGPPAEAPAPPAARERSPRILVSSQPRAEAAAPKLEPAAAPEPAPAARKVRCPGCKMMFEAAATRPLHVTCPHCGRRGVLR
jgi:hypothetical protein